MKSEKMQLKGWLESWGERLSSLAARLEATLPVRCAVWSHSLGECTAFDGHTMGLMCQLLTVAADDPEFLVLEIVVSALSSNPVLETAKLAWNHFDARTFKSPLRKPLPISAVVLEAVNEFYPRWESMFRRAVRKGVKRRAGSFILGMSCCSLDEGTEAELSEAHECELVHGCFSELFSKLEGEPLLLSPYLQFPEVRWLSNPGEILIGAQRETLEDFRRSNRSSARLPEDFRLGGRSTVLLDSIVSPAVQDIRHIYEKYPRTPGHFSFSRPGFNHPRNQALIVATRSDGLYSAFRPHSNPLLSSEFTVLCLLELEQSGWRLKQCADWTPLINRCDMHESIKLLLAQQTCQELSQTGWEVQESEDGRMRLKGSSGACVTVVTTGYLNHQLCSQVDESLPQDFFVCQDPVLIVSQLQASQILAGLR